jgi:hypothetical protein
MSFIRSCGRDLAECLARLTAKARVATVLGSIPASSHIVESEERRRSSVEYSKLNTKRAINLLIYKLFPFQSDDRIRTVSSVAIAGNVYIYSVIFSSAFRYLVGRRLVNYNHGGSGGSTASTAEPIAS